MTETSSSNVADRARVWSRRGGWLAVVTIAVLSLIPGEARPHMLSVSQLEHIVAYAGTALLLAVGYPGFRQRLLIVGGLSLYAGTLEIIQIFVPDRTAKVIDFIASSSGALAAVLVVLIWQACLSPPARLSSKLRG